MISPPRAVLTELQDRLSLGLGLAFLAAAAPAAALRATQPFEHGWWLVAYLLLVGGLSQLLLGPGRTWLLSRVGRSQPRVARLWGELVLWNVGTCAVPIGVFTDSASTVLAASAVLLIALIMYAAGLNRTDRGPGRLAGAYYLLVSFLFASVLVGTRLADALPWP
jgi:hypothetical protein